MKKIFAFAFLLAIVASAPAHFDKVLLTGHPDSKCLDGTPGAYFISRGTDPKRFVIYFEGGGWCGSHDLASTTESCYQRSKGDLGSSKNYPATLSISDGILSNNDQNEFKEATKVVLKYCDGSGHQGHRENPIKYKDATLYFNGDGITRAQLFDVETKEGLFSKATDIIVTGGSAGGLATFLWADFVKNKASTKNVYAVPDAGIFLDSPHFTTNQYAYRNQFANLFQLSNLQTDPPTPDCVKANPKETYRCMFAEEIIKYIKTPVFAIESLYDTWSIPNILGLSCLNGSSLHNCNDKQLAYIDDYHKNVTRVLKSLVSHNSKNGYWAPACAFHTSITSGAFYGANYRIPEHSNNSEVTTLLNWIVEKPGSNEHIDSQSWPSNHPCSGATSIAIE